MKKLNKLNSYRQQKVSSIIHAALIEILKRGRMLDVRLLNSPITITKVLVSGDLRIANCYFVLFNTNFKKDELIEALNNSKGAIRNFITGKIDMKYSPEIRFYYDHGFENIQKIEQLLKTI